MKKKIVNAFLMMALIVSSMGTFVSCKDYDEDAYVDLRNRISNEATLRENLQKQLEELKKAHDELVEISKTHVTKEELKIELAKYVTLEVYLKYVSETDTRLELLEQAKKALEERIQKMESEMSEMKDNVAEALRLAQEANKTASEAKALANEALQLAKQNAEDIKKLKEDVAKNAKDIQDLTTLVQGLDNRLTEVEKTVKTLENTVKNLQDAVIQLDERLTNLTKEVDSIKAVMISYELRIDALENNYEILLEKVNQQGDSISDIYVKIGDIYQQIENINKKIIEIQEEWNAQLVIVMNKCRECCDEVRKIAEEALKKAGDALVTAEAANAKASNAEQLALNAFYLAQEAVEIAKQTAADLEDAIKRAEDAAKRAEDAAKKAEEAWEKANGAALVAITKAQHAEAAQAAAEKAAADAEEWYNKMKDLVGCDCEELETVKKLAQEAKEKAEAAQKTADEAKKDAADAKLAADNAEKKAELADQKADLAQKAADDAQKTADEAKKAADDAQKAADEAKNKNKSQDEEIQKLWDKINSLVVGECPCGDLKKTVEDAMKEYIPRIEKLEQDTKDMANEIKTLGETLRKLKADFANMITGVIIQGTRNPVLGYVNIPFDVRSNMLMAYFGKADEGFAFPDAGGKWVNDDERFTDEDIDIMTGGGSLYSVDGFFTQAGGEVFAKDRGDGKVTMGSVFATVNPTNVNFTGQQFILENSYGTPSVVELAPVFRSSKTLTAGYDRTRATLNGFYETEAALTISEEDLNAVKISFDLDNMKDKVKAAYKSKTKSDIVSLAVDLFRTVDNVIDLNALKASWTDSDGKTNSVYSQYGIGCATLKPLSFNTLNIDRLKKGLPGKKWCYKFIDKIISQIKIHVPQIDLGSSIVFSNVEAKGNQVTVTATVEVNGKSETVTVAVTTTQEDINNFNQLVDLIITTSNGSTAAVEIGKLLTELNDLDTEWAAAIEQAKQDMIDGLQKYVDRAYTKANSIIQLYALFDITLVAHQTGKGFKFVNESLERATKINGETRLFPTSNTMEYFAPAYKKYVAISNVYDAATKTALSKSEAISKAQAAAGENFNKVIDGDTYVTINGEAGYIYEVSYAAVDYHGLKTRRTFYVEF